VFDGISPYVLVVFEFVGHPARRRVCDAIMNQVGPPGQNFGERLPMRISLRTGHSDVIGRQEKRDMPGIQSVHPKAIALQGTAIWWLR
jgi:hypothetical protein